MTTLDLALAPGIADPVEVLRARPRLSRTERERLHADSLLLPKDGETNDREPNRVDPRLALYIRRSFLTDTSISLGRQKRVLLGWVAELNGRFDPEQDVFYDDDVTAKGGAYRPEMERMLRLVQAGCYDGVLVWEISRWTRNKREGRILSNLLREAACELYSYEEKFLTLYGPYSQMYDFAVDLAAKESERIAARVMSWHSDIAKTGHARARAPFGMAKEQHPSPLFDRQAPILLLAPDVEPRDELDGASPADLIREAVDLVFDGQSLRQIVIGWNKQKFPSPRGRTWSSATLRQLLRNPELAGYAKEGDALVERDGKPYAPHTPLIPTARWHQLIAELDSRRGPAGERTNHDSELRGLIRCSACQGACTVGGPGKRNPTGTYGCARRKTGGCTSGGSISRGKTEALVWNEVLALLSDPARLEAELAVDPEADQRAADAAVRVAELQGQLDRLEEMKLAGDFADPDGKRRYDKRHRELTGPLTAALDQQARVNARRPRHALTLLDRTLPVTQAVAALRPEQRRSLLLDLIERIEVHPPTFRGPKFDDSRIRVFWRTEKTA